MTYEKSDYHQLRVELYRLYHRRLWLTIIAVISCVFGGLAAYNGISKQLPKLNIVIGTLFIIFLVFFILMLIYLFWVNMNSSEHEEKMVKGGLEYLSQRRLSKKRIDIIGKRAEIGTNALSSRTILPLSAIPFLITYFSGKISTETQLFIAIVIILIGSSFILELDRANIDILIRQIYVSYIPARREKKVNKK